MRLQNYTSNYSMIKKDFIFEVKTMIFIYLPCISLSRTCLFCVSFLNKLSIILNITTDRFVT